VIVGVQAIAFFGESADCTLESGNALGEFIAHVPHLTLGIPSPPQRFLFLLERLRASVLLPSAVTNTHHDTAAYIDIVSAGRQNMDLLSPLCAS
jgi:hypothetical protein